MCHTRAGLEAANPTSISRLQDDAPLGLESVFLHVTTILISVFLIDQRNLKGEWLTSRDPVTLMRLRFFTASRQHGPHLLAEKRHLATGHDTNRHQDVNIWLYYREHVSSTDPPERIYSGHAVPVLAA